MDFSYAINKGLVGYDGAANGTAKLVAHQVVANLGLIGKPIVCRQGLDPVVFENRAVPFVSSRLKHCIGDKAARLSVFGGEVVGDDTIFLDRVRGDAYCRSAFIKDRNLAAPSLTLLIVIDAFHKVVAGALASTVDCGATVINALVILRDSAGDEFDKRILVTHLERHALPDIAIHQLGKGGFGGLHNLGASFDGYLFAASTDLQFDVTSNGRSDANNNVGDLHTLEALGREFQPVGSYDGQGGETVIASRSGRSRTPFAGRSVDQGELSIRHDSAGRISHQAGELPGAGLCPTYASQQSDYCKAHEQAGQNSTECRFHR